MALHEVFAAADGSIIIVGEHGAFQDVSPHFWRSTDGRTWDVMRTDVDLPPKFIFRGVEDGPHGYLMLGFALRVDLSRHVGYELRHSIDGLEWELVWAGSWREKLRERIYGIGAGELGFAALGDEDRGWHDSNSFTLTSVDGRNWVSPDEPILAGVSYMWGTGNGWLAIATRRYEPSAVYVEEPDTTVWSSSDGLLWGEIGTWDLPAIEVNGDPVCYDELQDVVGAAGWFVMSRDFHCTYGDDEPGVSVHDIPRISIDGITWQSLPFPSFTVDAVARKTVDEGSTIRVAVASASGLVLAGESNGEATFWLGVPR